MLEEIAIKEAAVKTLDTFGYHLYSMRIYKRQGELILAIEIDESLDLDGITKVSEKLSEALDEFDSGDERYILDVSCAGIERAIALEDVDKAVGSYIHVELENHEKVEGDLLVSNADSIVLKTKNKNLYKEVTIAKSQIKKIRYAVKF